LTDQPEILRLSEVGEHQYEVFQPSTSAEGRDVVFSGQLLAQMIMAADADAGGAKDVRSVHAIFARSGTYTKPIVMEVDAMHAGRTWGSDTVTATQDGRLLSRSLILMNTIDPDLMRHGPQMPEGVPTADSLAPSNIQVFPGGEMRSIEGNHERNGVPMQMAWHRFSEPLESQAANQAILTWATCGNIIGLAMRPHRDQVQISDAHRTISTGVIAHTIHFVNRFDISDWLLVVTAADSAAGGRIYGSGAIYTADGQMVAVFHQDAMAKAAEASLDPLKSM